MSAIQQLLVAGGGGPVRGQITYTGSTVTSWICPPGVESVCIVCVGFGGTSNGTAGSGGGALSYSNNISTTPGEALNVRIDGVSSRVARSGVDLVRAAAGANSTNTGTAGGAASDGVGAVKQSGGPGRSWQASVAYGGGGGAAGYSGGGGSGGGSGALNGTAGTGGGGGGGGRGGIVGGGGGGTGLNGAAGAGAGGVGNDSANGGGGGGGSGGSGGSSGGSGGSYGGGAGGGTSTSGGGPGGVRIIWGEGRAFPSTNVQDM